MLVAIFLKFVRKLLYNKCIEGIFIPKIRLFIRENSTSVIYVNIPTVWLHDTPLYVLILRTMLEYVHTYVTQWAKTNLIEFS